MSNRGYITLRERAVRAWRQERPRRVAQLLKRAGLMLELREKLEEVLGDDLPIKLATDLRDRPIATIEQLRFTLIEDFENRRKNLMLLDACSRCEAETGLVIDSLANLGQLFEALETKVSLGCTECIGLTDDELRHPVLIKSTRAQSKRSMKREL
jgi:hypothetical protein